MQFIHARIDRAFSDECIIFTEDYGGLGAYVVMRAHNTSETLAVQIVLCTENVVTLTSSILIANAVWYSVLCNAISKDKERLELSRVRARIRSGLKASRVPD